MPKSGLRLRVKPGNDTDRVNSYLKRA